MKTLMVLHAGIVPILISILMALDVPFIPLASAVLIPGIIAFAIAVPFIECVGGLMMLLAIVIAILIALPVVVAVVTMIIMMVIVVIVMVVVVVWRIPVGPRGSENLMRGATYDNESTYEQGCKYNSTQDTAHKNLLLI